MQGSLAYPLPIVLGHEGAGVVEAVGRDVTQVKPGDAVVCSWNPHCGRCFYCERSLPILCEPFTRHQPKGRLLDGTVRMTRDGEPVHHYSVTSTHAEYTVVPESGAIPVPPELPFDRACLIGCGITTGLGAALNTVHIPAGASVPLGPPDGTYESSDSGSSRYPSSWRTRRDLNPSSRRERIVT